MKKALFIVAMLFLIGMVVLEVTTTTDFIKTRQERYYEATH